MPDRQSTTRDAYVTRVVEHLTEVPLSDQQAEIVKAALRGAHRSDRR